MTKFKTIPDDYYITILDRLTRFEPACVRYERVFNDLISKFCLDKIQKNISILDKITLTEELLDFNLGSNADNSVSSILTDLEGKYFEFNDEQHADDYGQQRRDLENDFKKLIHVSLHAALRLRRCTVK